jgi:hypothetical protein
MEKLKINQQIKELLISEIEKEYYNPVQHTSFMKYLNDFSINEIKDVCYTILLLKNDYKVKTKLSKSKKEKDSFIFYSELLEIYYSSAINILALYEE